MMRLLRRLYQIIWGKPNTSSRPDFDTLFALLEDERQAYRLENGMADDEPEIAVRARRAELIRYFTHHELSVEEMIDTIQQEKAEASRAQLTTSSNHL
jgi:hypothetical protein